MEHTFSTTRVPVVPNILFISWYRLPFLPEMELGSHDLEVFDRSQQFSSQDGFKFKLEVKMC